MSALRRLHLPLLWLAVFLGVWLLSLPQLGGPGLTWDEAFYYPTFLDAASWTKLLLADPGLALSADAIRAGWERINELPPVVKWLGAATTLLMPDQGWWRLGVMRTFPAAAMATSVLLVLLIGRKLCLARWGGFAAALLLLHPRLLFHAQFAATETVFCCVALLVTWVALQDLRRWRWRLLLAAACGLALATKVNGLILIAALGFWLGTRELIWNRRWLRVDRDAVPGLLILVGAPLVAWSLWPWMWDDTVARLVGYWRFITEHAHQGLWYMGKKWNFGGPLAPTSYPLVITHLTTPVLMLGAFWLGLSALIVRAVRKRRLSGGAYLLLLLTIAPLAASSLPNAPKYDGIRLFLPMFPAAALLAAMGLRTLSTGLLRRRLPVLRRAPLLALALVALTVVLPISRRTYDYYNAVARAIQPGDPVFPFEQTYWGNALDAVVIADLNQQLIPNARVKTLALQPDALTILQKWGELRGDIVFNGEPPYDYHLVQNRRGFWGRAEWALYANRQPLATWGIGAWEEPLVFLYSGEPPR